MQFTAAQIAAIIKGRVEGDANATVSAFGKIEEAQKGQLSFLANPKYEDYLYTTGASVIIVNESQELKKPVAAALIRVADAYVAFATLLEAYQQMQAQQLTGIQQPVYIDASAKIGGQVYIGAFAYIGEKAVIGNGAKIYPNTYIGNNTIIGENTVIHPGVKIYHNTIIGKNVTIHAGTVIGSDGFGFAPQADGTYKKVPQMGNVIIEDNVEVGSNTSIDRATMGSTILHKGVKLDNLVQIAHNAVIGDNTVIAGLSGIAGSTKVGKNCMVGAQVGVAGHLKIADGVKIAGQSGIGASIEKEGEIVQGSPAFSIGEYKRSYVLFRSLPKLNERLNELSKKINSK